MPPERPAVPVQEYISRSEDLYVTVNREWVAIYGDREHNANRLFFTGFVPRFEEALLLLGSNQQRILLVGNEGLIHAAESWPPVDVVLYQPFSLMGQPRGTSLRLHDLLRGISMQNGARVGVVGWKYLLAGDVANPAVPAYIPAFLLQALESVSGTPTTDVTFALMELVRGLRNRSSAAQIAPFEKGAVRSSAAVRRALRAARAGISELEAVQAMDYAGEPLSRHVMFSSAGKPMNGLRSPSARQLGTGEGVTVGIGS